MNRERMLDLISVLETIPEQSFDIGVWAKKTECGTVGCAIGHYVLQRPEVASLCNMEWGLIHGGAVAIIGLDPNKLLPYFDITPKEFQQLFVPWRIRCQSPLTKAAVMNRLMRFVSERSPSEEAVEAEGVLV